MFLKGDGVMRAIFFILFALGLVQGVCAEIRAWTDSKGRRIEAELVAVTDDAVILRRANGTEGKLKKSDLSTEDQEFLVEQERKQNAARENKKNTVSISRREIMVNDSQYIIRGVCYNPVPKGSSRRNFSRLTEDLALMVEAGINTIRVYSPINDKVVLDEIHAAGLKVIIGIGSGEIKSGSFIDYVNTYKDHGAILFWELGNECNYHPEWFDGDVQNWYTAMNKAARKIHSIDPSHPVATAHGELPDEKALSSCPNIDVWGINAYRGDNPESVFSQWKAISSKPMYLSEAGADRYMSASRNGYSQGENEDAQADATKNILDNIFRNKRICSGVTLFAFVDEWWKAGNNQTQDPGEEASDTGGAPYDGTFNEEYWGIVDIDRRKQKAYEVVKKKYTALR
jgi:hypothetical protein